MTPLFDDSKPKFSWPQILMQSTSVHSNILIKILKIDSNVDQDNDHLPVYTVQCIYVNKDLYGFIICFDTFNILVHLLSEN